MPVHRRNKLNLSDGERSVMLAYFAVSAFGAALSFIVVNNLGGGQSIIRVLSLYDIWSIVAGTVGAPVGLFAARGWFGHPGLFGILRSALGAVVLVFFGGIVGGTLALPFYGTMFGPFSVVMVFVGSPTLAVFYALMALAIHMLFAIYRRERDTLFVMPPDDGIPL